MNAPDAERGPATGPRSDQTTTRQLDQSPQSTAPVVAVDPFGIAMLDVELAEPGGRTYSPLAMQLLDTERAADRLLEELGSAHCRRLAFALIEKVREVTS